ncbi:MAG: ABC transporter ATP-binding protein [Terriglobales bacterium]
MRELLRLLKFVRRYTGPFAAAVLLMALVAALAGLVALLIAPVVDRVLAPASGGGSVLLFKGAPWFRHKIYLDSLVPHWFSHNPASLVLGVLVGAYCLKAAAEYLGTYLINYVGFGVVTDLRNALYEKLIHQSAAFFQRHTTPKLISTAINDIDKIQVAASHSLSDALQQGFTLLVMAVVLLSLNWRLTAMAMVLLPLVVIPTARLGKRVRRTTRRSQDKLADVQHILHETITGNRIVKAFNMEWREVQRFREAALRLFRENLRYILQQGVSSPLMEILGAVTLAVAVLYGRGAISHHMMTEGTFFAFIYALVQLYQPLRRMSGVYNSFEQAAGAAQTVFEYMDEREEAGDRPGARRLRHFRGSVRFEAVEFAYEPRQPLLRGVDLQVERGEVVAIVGSSGAGKTTLVNLIPRFFDVTGGRVLIDGHDVRDVTLRSLRDLIAYVTQDTILFNATAAQNIAYGAHSVAEARIRDAAEAALADDFIRAMPEGYETILGERGLRLSGGQRQRIAIARALLKNAPILILDEATSALDTESELLVQRALNNLMRNRTVFVIAHRLSTVRRADRIVVLENGAIVETGTHDELVAAGGAYRRLHDLQFAEVEEAPGGAPLSASSSLALGATGASD